MNELNELHIFATVVEAKSFTQAALQLNIAKSAVSRQVTGLETRLGVRLLQRTTRKLSLTEQGRALYERARPALRELQQAQRDIGHSTAAPRGRIAVAAPFSLGISHIAPLIADFCAAFAEISIELIFDDTQVDLVARGIDVAIRVATLGESSLAVRRLATVTHVVVAAPAYLRRHPAPRTPAALLDHPCLVYSLRAQPARWSFRGKDGRTEHVDVKSRLRANNSIAIREMVARGAGIAMIPAFVARDALASGSLQRILQDYSANELPLHAVLPTYRQIPPPVRAFIDYLERHLPKTL